MTNREVLEAFFKAENERDWEAYQQFLHSEISWQLFNKEEKKIVGIQDYIQVIKKCLCKYRYPIFVFGYADFRRWE